MIQYFDTFKPTYIRTVCIGGPIVNTPTTHLLLRICCGVGSPLLSLREGASKTRCLPSSAEPRRPQVKKKISLGAWPLFFRKSKENCWFYLSRMAGDVLIARPIRKSAPQLIVYTDYAPTDCLVSCEFTLRAASWLRRDDATLAAINTLTPEDPRWRSP